MPRSKKKKQTKSKPHSPKIPYCNSGVLDDDFIIYTRTTEKFPYDKRGKNGFEFEDSIFHILKNVAKVPENMLFRGIKYKPFGKSEVEISDGLILYGDTIFLIQSKLRNLPNSEEIDVERELKKMQERNSKAFKQFKESLEYMKHKKIKIESIDGNFLEVDAKKFNIVSLIILGHNNYSQLVESSSHIVTNGSKDTMNDLHRVSISFDDLSSVAELCRGNYEYFLNYLRRLQYQNNHNVNEEMNRFFSFTINNLYDHDIGTNFFIEYERAVLDKYKKGEIDKSVTRKLLYGLDYMLIDKLKTIQKNFSRKVGFMEKNSSDIDSFGMNTGIGRPVVYSTLFYTFDAMPKQVSVEILKVATSKKDQHPGHSVFAIAFDAKNMRKNTPIGVYLE